MSAGERTAEGDGDPGGGPDSPLSDQPLLELLDALVNDRGRVAAAEALGVNYRTMMNCYDSRHVSRRMRQALVDFRDSEGVGDGDGAEAGGGDGGAEDYGEPMGLRITALEEEGRGLREMVEAQAGQLVELGRRVTRLEKQGQQRDDSEPVAVEGRQGVWLPPRRGHGMPDAGVVTLEEQLDEAHAFGPAAPLVAEWRRLRTGGVGTGSRVERARASERRWELEIAMIDDFKLTLPPETSPLHESRRGDHLGWRRKTLRRAHRERVRAERLRVLCRVLTLGLWKN